MINKLFRLLLIAVFMALPASANAKLSPAELKIAATAQEKSNIYEKGHIVLVWPGNFPVNWYPESGVQGPEQLADWLEKCYVLCINWIAINPNRKFNAHKRSADQARLMFVHNGMRDYNVGGQLPRPVIGLRNFEGVGTEDWFGWLTHEMSHEFFRCFVENSDNNIWHEALCDYLRYWLLKESGMPVAARNWREQLRRAPRTDRYKGGADIIMNFHDRNGCQSPADFWKMVKRKKFISCFGQAPWEKSKPETKPGKWEKSRSR